MLATPFFGFYIIGLVMQSNQDYLVKLGLILLFYIVIHFAGKVFFDDRLINVLPMSLYLATKVSTIFYYEPELCSINIFMCKLLDHVIFNFKETTEH